MGVIRSLQFDDPYQTRVLSPRWPAVDQERIPLLGVPQHAGVIIEQPPLQVAPIQPQIQVIVPPAQEPQVEELLHERVARLKKEIWENVLAGLVSEGLGVVFIYASLEDHFTFTWNSGHILLLAFGGLLVLNGIAAWTLSARNFCLLR